MPENVFPMLETALLLREGTLADRCLFPIDMHAESVFASEEILSVKASTLCQIFKSDTLDINECFVLDLALKWAENKCKIDNVPSSMENKRKVLGPAFFEIRFALLPSERISDIVQSGLLTHEETVEMFLQHRESGVVMAHDKRVVQDVLFKSNVRSRGVLVAMNDGRLAIVRKPPALMDVKPAGIKQKHPIHVTLEDVN